MSRDIDFYGLAQNDPQLIAYIKQVHLKDAVEPNHPTIESHSDPPEDTTFVLKLLKNKVCISL